MDTDKLIDDLLNSFGALEIAHDRFCASITPETYDRQKLIRLYLAATAYSRSVEAFKDTVLSDATPKDPPEIPRICPFDPSLRERDRQRVC